MTSLTPEPTPEPTPAADQTQSESLEESVLDMLHVFDPTTALQELELLDEPAPEQPMPPAAGPDSD
jgi:hypothetical protein